MFSASRESRPSTLLPTVSSATKKNGPRKEDFDRNFYQSTMIQAQDPGIGGLHQKYDYAISDNMPNKVVFEDHQFEDLSKVEEYELRNSQVPRSLHPAYDTTWMMGCDQLHSCFTATNSQRQPVTFSFLQEDQFPSIHCKDSRWLSYYPTAMGLSDPADEPYTVDSPTSASTPSTSQKGEERCYQLAKDTSCKRKRRRLSAQETERFKALYARGITNPDRDLRAQLGLEMNMTPRGVQIWFQNARQKEKEARMKKLQSDMSSGEKVEIELTRSENDSDDPNPLNPLSLFQYSQKVVGEDEVDSEPSQVEEEEQLFAQEVVEDEGTLHISSEIDKYPPKGKGGMPCLFQESFQCWYPEDRSCFADVQTPVQGHSVPLNTWNVALSPYYSLLNQEEYYTRGGFLPLSSDFDAFLGGAEDFRP